MGQYATFDIDVKGFKVIIKRALLSWGTFHELGDKSKEIKRTEIEGKLLVKAHLIKNELLVFVDILMLFQGYKDLLKFIYMMKLLKKRQLDY
ncbi:hypothetical protein [Fusobacterium ulcerans]|mgnify:CR=1 FL=1|uniref:hypothetical protein n=1 Tax=Fusobacterium ulcerans TaxID=861 RepID=UPI00241F2BA8|nr:hypothetical protein [Fusobacterium ulcerans]